VSRQPSLRLTVVAPLAFGLALASTARATEADPWFGRDKALHFGATFTLASGGYAGTALLTERPAVRAAAGAGLGLGAGIAKEVYDRYAGGDPSWRDLTWDAMGTATGVLVAWLVDRYLL
jgi:putative lipoprotein